MSNSHKFLYTCKKFKYAIQFIYLSKFKKGFYLKFLFLIYLSQGTISKK